MLENLTCLFCNDEDALVRMDLTADHTFTCSSCDTEWDEDEVRAKVEAWTRMLKWLETSPFRCEAAKPAKTVA